MEGTQQNQIIITGATGSMGAVAVRSMASQGRPVIMACRNLKKGAELRDSILKDYPDACLELMCLDLDSLEGVRRFLKEIGDRKISGIFNNAGVISRGYSLTEDGMEHTMAVNFVNPAFLTLNLLPNMEKGAHIVNMVSLTTRFGRLDSSWMNYRYDGTFNRLKVYSNSKLAFLLFSVELAVRNPELYVNVSDPGVVDSNMISMGKWYDPLADIFFRPFISSPEKGVAPALRALDASSSLGYYVGKSVKPVPAACLENPLSKELFSYVEKL